MFTLFGIAFFLIGVALLGLGVVGEYVGPHLRAGAPAPALHWWRGAGAGGRAGATAGAQACRQPQRRSRRCRRRNARGEHRSERPDGRRLRLSRRRSPLPARHCSRRACEVPLVVTVADDPKENRWYASVAHTAADYGLESITPAPPRLPGARGATCDAQPDFLFSFYYRSLLARRCCELHGAAPSTCTARCCRATAAGRRSTGRSSRASTRPARRCTTWWSARTPATSSTSSRSPSSIDDDAREVFAKVTVAAETILARSLPQLDRRHGARGGHSRSSRGSTSDGGRPEDGRIDWAWPARARSTTWCGRSRRLSRAPSATSAASAGAFSARV